MQRLFPIAIWVASLCWAQDLSQDIDRYLPFRIEDIEALGQDLNFDPRGVVDNLTKELSRFYLSDPSQKKIEQRQLLQGDENLYVREWNVNIRRLFIRDLLGEVQKSFVIKEAPNIALMHLILARAYIRQRKPYHAAYHYAMTLRYRSLSMSEQVYTDPDRLKLLGQASGEIRDSELFQKTKEALEEARRDENRLRIFIYSLEDNQRKAMSGERQWELAEEIRQNKERLAAKEKEREALEKQMEEHKSKFAFYREQYNRQSSAILVEMADLVRQIEDSLKERQKVLNKKVLYKTEFNQTLIHDYSQNRQFTAYANLLEAASRLDEKNPQIPYRLGKEYATSQEVRRAIYAYEKTLKAQQEAPLELKLENKQLFEIYVALGSLYFQTNQMVESAYYYEEALKNAPTEASEEQLKFQLAKLHIERTGNYRRGIELLLPYQRRLLALDPTDKASRTSWLKERFLVSRLLAMAYEKTNERQELARQFMEALQAHEELEKIIEEQRRTMQDTFRRMQEAKKPLLSETRQAEYNEFRRLEDQYELQKIELSEMLVLRNNLPISSLYFQYAHYLEGEKDIDKALGLLEKAEMLGLEPDRARRMAEELRRRYHIKRSEG
ncbi:MAG: hypothetical protein NZM25_05135 [Leptospiraceae bacterium]|nr:hypothetical protein [Leptospiraceae bacterium]MDW8305608.1 hypothetical protein [Leptospiraceae bacterium]